MRTHSGATLRVEVRAAELFLPRLNLSAYFHCPNSKGAILLGGPYRLAPSGGQQGAAFVSW